MMSAEEARTARAMLQLFDNLHICTFAYEQTMLRSSVPARTLNSSLPF